VSSGTSRPYRKRRRAEQEARTRLRITEAAARLHGTVGPARTTVSLIAAEAGVQRATVYRHFPDAESLFQACSAHWASANPPPDPGAWQSIEDPARRLRAALDELYRWYEWAAPMLANVLRDAPSVPAMGKAFDGFAQRFEALAAALLQGRSERGRPRARVAAAIGHAMAFDTWRSLTLTHGLRRAEAVELMLSLVDAAAALGEPRPGHRGG